MNSPEPGGCLAPDAIRAATARLLESQQFQPSRRLRRFLSYIVEETLAGRAEQIKEYNIAVTVFDRGDAFDAGSDNIVRVEARRLRQQLAAYYAGPGFLDPLIIEIPKGGYVPAFHLRSAARAPHVHVMPPPPAGARHWIRYAGLSVLAALLIASAFAAWQSGVLPWSRVPVHWSVEGSTLTVLDGHGRLCWQKQFPPFHREFSIQIQDKAVIADIDGDGHKEVLFNYFPEDVREGTGSLLCFEQRGRLRWQFTYGAPKTIGSRKFEVRYRGHLIRTVRIAGKPYVLTVANHHIWYPAQIALVDALTGKLVEDYWHPGGIGYCILYDLDRDGRQEVLFGGLNNPGDGLGHAAVGILKLPFSKAPRREPLPGDPLPPQMNGGELAYVLFPRSDTNTALGILPSLTELSVDEHQRIVAETRLPEEGALVYYLDFGLNVQEFRTSDGFSSLHERLYGQHFLDHHLSDRETAALRKVVRFPWAPDGNSPELTRFWKF